MSDVNITTETTETESEVVTAQASVEKKTLITAGIAAAVGATAMGVVCYLRNRDGETPEYYISEMVEGDVVTDAE